MYFQTSSVYGNFIECPHECGQCTHHINSDCSWTLIGCNMRSTFKKKPTEIAGYGPDISCSIMYAKRKYVKVRYTKCLVCIMDTLFSVICTGKLSRASDLDYYYHSTNQLSCYDISQSHTFEYNSEQL